MFDLETTQHKRAPQPYAHFSPLELLRNYCVESLDGVTAE
jgi:hypothetical protein